MNEKMIEFGSVKLLNNKKQLTPVMTYSEMLSRYTVEELKQIASHWDLSFNSSVKKAELVNLIVKHIIKAIEIEDFILTKESVLYLKTYLTQTGERTAEMANGAAFLRANGIVFTGLYENQLIEIIPGELAENLAKMVGLRADVHQHQALAALLDTIVIYNGTLTFDDVVLLVRASGNVSGSDQEILEEIHHALHITRLAKKTDFLLAHGKIKNPQKLYEAIQNSDQNMYASIDAQHVEAVRKKQSPAFSIHHDRLKQFIVSDLRLDPVSAHLLLDEMMIKMNLDWQFDQIISDLDGMIKFEHPEQRNGLVQLLSLVYQHTPKWLEKGHTPNSLYIPKDDTKPDLPDKKSVQVVNEVKIGRNDLCPCGSGKKYKKCCLNK